MRRLSWQKGRADLCYSSLFFSYSQTRPKVVPRGCFNTGLPKRTLDGPDHQLTDAILDRDSGSVSCRITGFDANDKSDRPRQYKLLADRIMRLYHAVRPFVDPLCEKGDAE